MLLVDVREEEKGGMEAHARTVELSLERLKELQIVLYLVSSHARHGTVIELVCSLSTVSNGRCCHVLLRPLTALYILIPLLIPIAQ